MGGGLQTVRGLVVNWLITASVGSVGISAYTAANNVLGLFWAVSAGMLAVSRTMLGISVGEEDRQTLSDIMKAVWRLHIPLQLIVSVIIIVAAKPLTQTFFLDPSDPVYMMTVWGFRILPLCMPLVILVNHSRCYAQMSNQMGFVNVSSILDGALCVCLFTFILIRPLGMNGVYIARVLNCIVCVMHIFAYAWFKVKHFPKTREELMAIPDDFGVPEDERLSLVMHDVDDAETVSRAVYEFCKDRGIDEERSRNAGLAMKELTSTIVTVGFPKDKKPNTVEIRVMHTDDSITMIVKDDCVAFPPIERAELVDSEERENNPGLSMIIDVAEDVNYQNLYGMNIWTIKI